MKTTTSYKLTTTDGHQLHVEESGNRAGPPALFLHGGPGAGIGQNYLWPFAHTSFRLIAFDQRGCGHSQPFADIKSNTTEKLIEDIELIREYFGIEDWLVFGGSWGSTLGLVYAINYPHRVSAMVLRGIYLARQQDMDWFMSPKGAPAQIFHKQYQSFTQGVIEKSAMSLCRKYFAQLTHKDENVRSAAANRWFNWEGSISKLQLLEQDASEYANAQQIYSLALMECFYLLNNCFIPENYILDNANKIAHIPTHIIHGRYDMVCKCEAALSLHERLATSTITIVPDAGHSMNEKGISSALIKSLKYFCQVLNK